MDDDNCWYFIVWDPVTGDQQLVPAAGIDRLIYTAAVFCAVSGCDHIDCHDGPFCVVFIATDDDDELVKASMYSSETVVWSTPVTLGNDCEVYVQHVQDAVNNRLYGRFYTPYVQPRRSAVIGDQICFTLRRGNAIIKYDLGKNALSMINAPSRNLYYIALMEMEGSALGFACIQDRNLYLRSRQLSSESAGVWVQSRVIELEGKIPIADPDDEAVVVDSVEGVGAIFVTIVDEARVANWSWSLWNQFQYIPHESVNAEFDCWFWVRSWTVCAVANCIYMALEFGT